MLLFKDAVLIWSGDASLVMLQRRNSCRGTSFEMKTRLLKQCDLRGDASFGMKTQLSLCEVDAASAQLKRRDFSFECESVL